MDVEGWESLVFMGAQKFSETAPPNAVIFEAFEGHGNTRDNRKLHCGPLINWHGFCKSSCSMIRYLLVFPVAVFIAIAVSIWLPKFLRFTVYRELRMVRKQFNKSLKNSTSLFAVVGFSLLIAILAGWAGKPIFGLLGLISLPYLLKTTSQVARKKSIVAMDESGLAYLYGLQGLLKVGASLPVALIHLSDTFGTPFSKALKTTLRAFNEGKSLTHCLSNFRRSSAIDAVGSVLTALELAYQNGFPIRDLLDRMLTTLELELESSSKIRTLLRTSVTQAVLAGLIPWFILGFLGVFHAGLIEGYFSLSLAILATSLALAAECAGIVLIWRQSRFL